MSEVAAHTLNDSEHIESDMRERLDSLLHGECTADEFVREMLASSRAAPDSAWDVLSFLDQQYRRGHLSADIFHSIESRIARHALKQADHGQTVDLQPEPAVAGDAPVARVDPGALRGRLLGNRYVLESVLGSGGMGTVFKASDRHRSDLPAANRYVAIKILHRAIGERPEMLAALRREFYCAQSIAHQNIVRVFDIDQDGGLAFFSMELLEGELLSTVIGRSRTQPLDRAYAWAVVRDICAGVAHAHAHQVVHGDLKPQNVMITHRGEVRILDFGASGIATRNGPSAEPLCRDSIPTGTPAYACCELLDGQQTDPRDDLYALACLTYELLCAEHPFQHRSSTDARELGIQPARPPGLTQRQWHALRQGLAWQRDDRPESVQDWSATLGLNLGPGRLPAPKRASAVRLPPWKWSSAQRTGVIGALIAAVGVSYAFIRSPVDSVARTGPPWRAAPTLPAPRPTAPAPPALQSIRSIGTQGTVFIDGGAVHSSSPAASSTLNSVRAAFRQVAVQPTASAEGANAILATGRKVRVGQGFAEVTVRRPDPGSGQNGFVWWTVGATAIPGADFVPQTRTAQFFSSGRRSTTLFVKLLPNPARKHRELFYIAIAPSTDGDSRQTLARAAIWVPPQS